MFYPISDEEDTANSIIFGFVLKTKVFSLGLIKEDSSSPKFVVLRNSPDSSKTKPISLDDFVEHPFFQGMKDALTEQGFRNPYDSRNPILLLKAADYVLGYIKGEHFLPKYRRARQSLNAPFN